MFFKINNYGSFFLMMVLMSTFCLLSSKSWFSLWIWLEINLISFIAFMINNCKNNLSIESSLIYFLIQTISSIILFFSIIMINFKYSFLNLLFLSVLIKLGSAPFHYWMPLMIEGLNWFKMFFLLTWQKINPLFILMNMNYYNFINMFIMLTMIISTLSGLNFMSLKKMISFSSINQLSWMMLSLMNNKMIKIYMLFYMFLMWTIIKSLSFFNLKFLNQLFNLNLKNKFIKLFIFMNFLSLGGLPPFLGFFPKMLIIMKMNNLMMLFFLILFTLLMLFMYLRIIFSLLMLNSMKINKIKFNFNYYFYYKLMKMSIFNNFFLIMMMFLY